MAARSIAELVAVGEAQQDTRTIAPLDAQLREGDVAIGIACGGQPRVRKSTGTGDGDVKAGRGWANTESTMKMCAQRPGKDGAPPLVERVHSPNVAREVAVRDEEGGRGLQLWRDPEARARARDAEGAGEMRRDDQIAQPDGRRERLAEAPDIENALVAIEALQCR